MKLLFSIAAIICCLQASAKVVKSNNASPLGKYAKEWNDPKYRVCNTAAKTKYLSEQEKMIIYVLNLARMNPKLFCSTVVAKMNSVTSYVDTGSVVYYKSLVKEMQGMAPLPLLKPDSLCYISSRCHADNSGQSGYVGHDRQIPECIKVQHFNGECIQFGLSDPLAIVLVLLVDQDVPSLGHRNICFTGYTKMSPAMGSHKSYGTITVLDFCRK